MATTTTWHAIRDAMTTNIHALTPTLLPTATFDRAPDRYLLRAWAAQAGNACFRRFEILATGPEQEASLMDPEAVEVIVPTTIMIAYPSKAVALYGTEDLKDLEKLVRTDARQIRDVVWNPGNYLAGQYLAPVTINQLERVGDVWFQTLTVALQFLASQSLT